MPSGLFSDHGTGALRSLFLEHCRWEWLFGFENRDGIFDIHRSYKFNPVIIEKGGTTKAIRTAFMRRKIRQRVKDPETAEMLVPKDHGFGNQRVPLETRYYEAYNLDNVRLVDATATPIEMTPPKIEPTKGMKLINPAKAPISRPNCKPITLSATA